MPSHCAICGHTDFTNWRDYMGHMGTMHNVTVAIPAANPPKPTKTTNRSTHQIVEALELKLGKHNFFNVVHPGLEDQYVQFMRGLRK